MRYIKLLIVVGALAVTGTLWALNNGPLASDTAAGECPVKSACSASTDCSDCATVCSGCEVK